MTQIREHAHTLFDCRYKTGSIYRDREVAKLLRMVEQELSKNTYTMDWTKWQNAFYERDRDHRETLSAAQVITIADNFNIWKRRE